MLNEQSNQHAVADAVAADEKAINEFVDWLIEDVDFGPLKSFLELLKE